MHERGLQKAMVPVGCRSATLHNVSYAALLLGLLLLCFLDAATSHAEEIPLWGYLDNGLSYVLIESHAAPLVGSSVIVHSGSAREEFATNGASHFLEHLLFNGTEQRTQEELYDDVDAIGGYNNATTRRSHVAYMMLTPAEMIGEGLAIQADMLFHSTLPEEKVEKERGIILEELSKDRDQGSFELERAIRLATFGPEGQGLPIVGSEQSISSISREAILDFYRGFYTPQNMTLVVVGDFDPTEMEQHVAEIFGRESPGPPPPPYRFSDPIWDGRPILTSHTGSNLVLEWTSPGPDPSRRDFIQFECLVDLVTGSDAAPLNRALRERFPGKILTSRGSIEMVPGRSYLHYRVDADPSLDWQELAQAVPEILGQTDLNPIREEIDAWRTSRETEEYFLREKPHYYPILRGEQIAVQGIESILSFSDLLKTLSPATVAQAGLGIEGNAYRLAVAIPRSTASSPDSSASAARTLKQTSLGNGARVLVLSSTESPVLAIHLFIKGRSEAEPPGMDGAVELLQRLMTVRTAESDPIALERKIRSIGAELKTADNPYIPYDDFYTTHDYSYLRLQSLDRYAEPAFSLLAELLGPPAWTDQEFEEERGAMLSLAERRSASARDAAGQLVRETLYRGTVRERSLFGGPEEIGAMKPEALRALASHYFVGQRLLLVVATSLPPEEVLEMARTTIGMLPAGESSPPAETTGDWVSTLRRELKTPVSIPEGLEQLALPDSALLRYRKTGAQQARIVWVRPLGSIDPSLFPAVEVWNATLSNEIQFQLREREGLAYSIGSSVEQLDDGTVLWTAAAGTGAANLPRILEGFAEQFEAALASEPEAETVRRQGVQIYGRSLMRRATRMNRAYAAGLAVLGGRDPSRIDDEIRASMAVTPPLITQALPALRVKRPSLVVIVE